MVSVKSKLIAALLGCGVFFMNVRCAEIYCFIKNKSGIEI